MAKREKSDIVSGLGVALKIFERLQKGGISDTELCRLLEEDDLVQRLKRILQMKTAVDRIPGSFFVSYDQSLGLRKLIELAVGDENLRYINPDITQERFPLVGTNIRELNLRVEPYLDGETCEQVTIRLKPVVSAFANTGDLAEFTRTHPKEMSSWRGGVMAISEDSRWEISAGVVSVPIARVTPWDRGFNLTTSQMHLFSDYGVLVVE